MKKTNKEGVYTRVKNNGSIVYIITYRINGIFLKKTLGTNKDGWTVGKAVKERLKRIHDSSHKEEKVKQNNLTFHEAAQQYFMSISHKPDYNNTKSRYKNHLQPAIGRKLLKDVTVHDIQRLKQKLSRTISKATKRNLAKKTIDDRLNLIDTIYNYHNKVNYKDQLLSPANKNLVSRFNEDNARRRFLTKEEYQYLLKCIANRIEFEDSNYVHQYITDEMIVYVKLLVTTGMRTYSALTLRVKDFDFKKNTIQVQNHKSKRTYTSFIHQSVQTKLKELCESLEPETYVFGQGTAPYHRSTINKRLLPLLHKLFNQGIEDRREKVVVHTFRHTFGSWLAQQGTSLYIISKLMDHSDVSQTQVYSKLAPNSGEDAVFSLEL